jgi:hypothetical protein
VQTTDAQVRKLMKEMRKHGRVGVAAARAGMDRKTARKYLAAGRLPSELVKPRSWRTRENPFAEDWAWVEGLLRTTPDLEAKTLFEALCERRPEHYQYGQLRTLQRHVRQWRAQHGPEKRVFFAQDHRPGEAAQTDFTWATELGVSIAGALFVHMLCQFVLPYSNWQWATVCLSESMLALQRGIQEAVFRLGKTPKYHQTDNSTAATHMLGDSSKRPFNREYQALMDHLGMTPRTTGIGEKEQNGDVESANGALKAYLRQQLLLRGNADFASEHEYEQWLWSMLERRNRSRSERLEEELKVMAPLLCKRLPAHRELDARVSSWSTIRVMKKSYSVPSRLIGETVQVLVTEREVEVIYGGATQLRTARLTAAVPHRINYRHVIWSLVQRPGAFARYRYREEMFPTVIFRKAYDQLSEAAPGTRGDLEYLRILHLAAATLEADVEAALRAAIEQGRPITFDGIRNAVQPVPAELPEMAVFEVDLATFDGLIASAAGGVT